MDLSDNEIGGYQGSKYLGGGEYEQIKTPEGPAALADGLKANFTVQELDASVNGLDQASKDGLTKAKPPQLVTLKL